MTEAHATTEEDRQNLRWVVQFEDFRYRDDRQKEILQSLDRGVLAQILTRDRVRPAAAGISSDGLTIGKIDDCQQDQDGKSDGQDIVQPQNS